MRETERERKRKMPGAWNSIRAAMQASGTSTGPSSTASQDKKPRWELIPHTSIWNVDIPSNT